MAHGKNRRKETGLASQSAAADESATPSESWRGTKNRAASAGNSEHETADIGTVDVTATDTESADTSAVENPEPAPKKRRNGAKKLKNAASKVIAANCQELAKLLIDQVFEGEVESARMLFELSEKKQPEKDSDDDYPSQALLLGSEEQWEDECCVPPGTAPN